MQVLKKEIRKKILDSSKKLFAQKGFRKTSMREIADVSGVSLGNLYNYFTSKDEILNVIVAPVTDSLVYVENSLKEAAESDMITDEIGKEQLDLLYSTVLKLRRQRPLVKILLYKSEGSELNASKNERMQEITEIMRAWREKRATTDKNIDPKILDFIIQMHVNWMISLMVGLVMDDFTNDQILHLLNGYSGFDKLFLQGLNA